MAAKFPTIYVRSTAATDDTMGHPVISLAVLLKANGHRDNYTLCSSVFLNVRPGSGFRSTTHRLYQDWAKSGALIGRATAKNVEKAQLETLSLMMELGYIDEAAHKEAVEAIDRGMIEEHNDKMYRIYGALNAPYEQ